MMQSVVSKRLIQFYLLVLAILYMISSLYDQPHRLDAIKSLLNNVWKSSVNLTTINVTTELIKTTTTTSKPKVINRPLPRQPIEHNRLNQLLNQVRPIPGRVNDSFVYGLKDMLGKDLEEVNNVYNYDLLITPSDNKECSDKNSQKLLLVALVYVAADFFEKRRLIRSTWATKTNNSFDFKTFFVLGLSRNQKFNEGIKNESRVYNDIIQHGYYDSYYNLTSKLICSMQWTQTKCPNAVWILRINDDIVLNTNNVIKYLKNLKNQTRPEDLERIIIGNLLYQTTPIRFNHKFQVSVNDYSGNKYFPYMEGSAYILTRDLAGKFYELAKRVYWPPFSVWLEDVYVGKAEPTRLLISIINIPIAYLRDSLHAFRRRPH